MATTFTTVDAYFLQSQCKYGLIVAHPVSQEECDGYWKKLKMYTKGIKSKNWTPSCAFNVMCAHPNCQRQRGWNNRVNARNFKDQHWKKEHPTETDIRLKVVSHWVIEKEMRIVDDKAIEFTKCVTEYRLVTKCGLTYINPQHQVDMNMMNCTANDNQLDVYSGPHSSNIASRRHTPYQSPLNQNDINSTHSNQILLNIGGGNDLNMNGNDVIHMHVMDTTHGPSDDAMDLLSPHSRMSIVGTYTDDTMGNYMPHSDEDDDFTHGDIIQTSHNHNNDRTSETDSASIHRNLMDTARAPVQNNHNASKRKYIDSTIESDCESIMPTKKRKIHETQHEAEHNDEAMNVLADIQRAVRDLNQVADRLSERDKQFRTVEQVVVQLQNVSDELKHTKEQFDDLQNAFKDLECQYQSHLLTQQTEEVNTTNQVVNDMDVQRSDLKSKHLLDYTSNEGKHIWSFDQHASTETHLLQCKLCAKSKDIKASILNQGASDEKKESASDEQKDTANQKKTSFAQGQSTSLCVCPLYLMIC
eukprot:169771_1